MNKKLILFLLFNFIFISNNQISLSAIETDKNKTVTVYPEEYTEAIRNPIMGFTLNENLGKKSLWTSLMHSYIAWDWIEDTKNDGLDKIEETCNRLWKDVEKYNIKVIPRVFLYYPGPQKDKWDYHGYHFPADINKNDYTCEQFINRVKKLIVKLGKCWNNDPRIAFIEMGIIGKWGEQHTPSPSNKIQKVLGESFRGNFKNKKITVRYTWKEFKEFKFGEYWDSWGHVDKMNTEADGIFSLKNLWKTEIIGGETAYDWEKYYIQPGKSPTESVALEEHRKFIINTIKKPHSTQLRWISDYDKNNPDAAKGAEIMQKAFGYRFLLKNISYNYYITPVIKLNISLKVLNDGSAPFYYNWPLEISLHDSVTKKIVWKKKFKNTDIRTWLPGDKWSEFKQKYNVVSLVNTVEEMFHPSIPDGICILSIAILDPAVMKPSLRFAVKNYWNGGRHPIGYVTKGINYPAPGFAPLTFNDLNFDESLNYLKK